MKRNSSKSCIGQKRIFIVSVMICALTYIASSSNINEKNDPNTAQNSGVHEQLLMDFGWRFAFGHAFDAKKDFNHNTGYFSYVTKAGYGDGPASQSFDDRAWRELNLPHDWAVELPFDPNAGYSHGYKTVGRNYPGTSIGWYRKTFDVPASDLGKRILVRFDGVHRDSKVWLNGFYLGEEHSGYYGFSYDVTDYINYGGNNVVAVRVDATTEEGWYYEGAGIYRHVWLIKTAPLHVMPDGIFVSSVLERKFVTVNANTSIINEERKRKIFDIEQTIVDRDGSIVARCTKKNIVLNPAESKDILSEMKLTSPVLWSIEIPYLYTLFTSIITGGKIVDGCKTNFGVRNLRFDSKKGFFLNGKHVLLKGTNNHQDHSGVGTAMPDALQEFRIKRLKEMGSNAYRCSHNPPTPELLDICDRLGMLVIDENRLMGTNSEHLEMLKKMIMRDRNHPSVMLWSIGNEEWAIEGNETGARIAETMQSFVKRLDPTRPVIAATSGWGKGISSVIDVMGFNYIFNGDIDKQHREFPDQPAVGTEETTSRSTRGVYFDDPALAHMAATDRKISGRSIEEGFKFYEARPFLSGLFFWTGFDYRGEPHPYGWPQVASQSGILDLCGFPKDMFYYLRSWWTDVPVLHIFPHWNWKGKEGDTIKVWVYSNCDEVEIFLNGTSCGRKPMPRYSHIEWPIVYIPGNLLARGFRDGKEIISDQNFTAGEQVKIGMIPDRTVINADGEDVSIITILVEDSAGRMVPSANNEIEFKLSGPAHIIGVGNGDPSSHEADKYIEDVSQIRISDLKAKVVEKKNNYPETGNDWIDSAWVPLLNEQEEYGIQKADSQQVVVIRGKFFIENSLDKAAVSLWPKSLGEVQSVYINGRNIAQSIKRSDPVKEYKIENSILFEGKNTYAIVGIPLVKRYIYDNLNTDPGIIQVKIQPHTWKRKLFNGLAQLIVQSEKEAGTIIIEARAAGLTSGKCPIRSVNTDLRPAIMSR